MDNLDFLKQVLMSDTHYWIVARKEYTNHFSRSTAPDSLWFIAIDYNIVLNKKYEDISLADIEKLNESQVANIALTENYPPFQLGISMSRMYKGWPVTEATNIKQVMIDAINLGSKDFYDYKELTEQKQTINS